METRTTRVLGVVASVAVVAAGAPLTPSAAVLPTVAPTATSPIEQSLPVNSRLHRAGSPPLWIQHPYLKQKSNGRLAVKATVYLDPFKGPNPKKYAQNAASDRLHFEVAVARNKFSKVNKPHAVGMLPDHALLSSKRVTSKIHKKGAQSISVTLPKKVSKKLLNRSFAGKRSAVSVVAKQFKDTKSGSPKWALKQVSPIALTSGKFSQKTINKFTLRAKEQVDIYREKPRTANSEISAQSEGSTPMYNVVNVQNSTPFAQNVAMNPNIECMWTGAYPNSNQQSSTETLTPEAGLQFYYEGTNQNSEYPGMRGATKAMNAPGTQGNLLADLSQAATTSLQTAEASLTDPATYSEDGASTAAASVGLTFATSFIKGLFNTKTCSSDKADYPQLFGISTQVVGFGVFNSSEAVDADYPPTNTWAGTGRAASGNMAGLPAVQLTPAWEQQYLQPMLGAQTVSSYYWNGGQPAPMVSNNESGTPGNYNGGSATYQGGLIQFAGPNPGQPAGSYKCKDGSDWSETCTYNTPYGILPIQLQFLTNPYGQAGLFNQNNPPDLTVTESSGTYTLSCNLADMTATLSLPYGYDGQPSTAESSTMMDIPLNNSSQKAQNGNWLVNFYGIADVNGTNQYVYFGDSWQNTDPSPTTGYTVPGLGPNAGLVDISIAAAASGGSGTTALATVTAADLGELFTADGVPVQQSDLVAFGCNATPSVSLPGLSIVSPQGSPTATSFGAIDSTTNQGWPMPGNKDGWPTTAFVDYPKYLDYSWQTPVNQLNVTFQGVPVGDIALLN